MKRFLKVIIWIAVICLLVYFVPKVYHSLKNGDNTEISSNDVNIYLEPVSSEEIEAEKTEFEENLKQMASEIDGMTGYDKYIMGLNPFDEDTDNDGLTDADELNVYNSDPLKKSTAGDLYLDGYKVENDMDLFTYYEYEGDYEFPNVRVDNVTPIAKSADEAIIGIYDYYSTEEIKKISDTMKMNVYKVFNVSENKYQLPILVDVSELIKANDISVDDIEVIYCQSAKFYDSKAYEHKNAEFSTNGSVLALEPASFDNIDSGCNPYSYDVVIASKKTFIESIDFLSLFSDISDEEQIERINEIGLAYGECGSYNDWAITKYSWFGNDNADPGCVKIYYYDTGNEEVNNRAINNIKEQYRHDLGINRERDSYKTFCEIIKVDDYNEVLKKCREYNDSKKNIKNEGDDVFTDFLKSIPQLITSVATNMESLDGLTQVDEIKEAIVFDRETDIFPFTNFISKRKDNGNVIGGHCAAIATITAKAFNGSYVEEKGQWTQVGTTSTAFWGTNNWDLSVDSANSTLMDKGLSDFKNADFVDRKGNITEDSIGASEFLNLADCYLEEYNNYSKLSELMNISGKNIDKYPFYNVEQMMEYLNSGKILVVGFLDSQMGHAVNVYDYNVVDDETIEFSIYDNNHPADDSLKLIVKKNASNPYYMDYEYNSPDHLWSSVSGMNYKLIVTDENMYFLTDTKRLQSENGEVESIPHNNIMANKEIDKIRAGN